MDTTINVGSYLKSLRGKISLGQVETMTGVTKSYLSKVERGERGTPSPKVLNKLAKAYGVDYDELLATVGLAELEPIIITIKRAAKKMSPEQKGKMMDVLRESFNEFFPEKDDL